MPWLRWDLKQIKIQQRKVKGMGMKKAPKRPDGMQIFGSRFVDELKEASMGKVKKSRLVAQNYSDEVATRIATKAPIVKGSSQRLIRNLAASIPKMNSFARNITQKYIQNNTELERNVYIFAPPEMKIPPNTVLKVVKTLYGIPESGIHWYLTHQEHHIERLGMRRSNEK